MSNHMLIFGMGYTASRLGASLVNAGWQVTGIRRSGGHGVLAFDDHAGICNALSSATHVLSSVPPAQEGHDPVLKNYGEAIAACAANWLGYLSSTGVYGDTGGAWVDESAAIGRGRRTARAEADLAWQALRPDMNIFRLPGIYGPARSALDRVRAGRANRIDVPGQIFSRIHVDDIVSAVRASFAAFPGVYNISDDRPATSNEVIEFACNLAGLPWPGLQSLEEATISPMARGFYSENRRVSNLKAKRLLAWNPTYSDYKQGLAQIWTSELQAFH
ncbi:MAG: SDR family oxidoreductase [Sphingorhabdus sp.]